MKPALVVLAAGMGSRYGGVKQIDGVGLHNETLLDYATFDARRAGYGSAVYIIRKDIEADFRARFFDRVAQNMDASYVFQNPGDFLTGAQRAAAAGRTKPWGTIHALLSAKDAVKTPFTVINADDYYGASAFQTLGAYLSTLSNEANTHAMAGYVLKSTMSRSGTVSRGVCEVKDGYLVSMRELHQIGWRGEAVASLGAGEEASLSGEEPVSMNFFGFTPAVFPRFSAFFEEFIVKNAGDGKAECLLPDGASAIVSSGAGSIRVFMSEESWFGMTYPEDRALVRAEIAEKIRRGAYPERLWESS
jgi:hypothetical protein